MEKKMTYVQALDKALEVVTDKEVATRLTELKASINKRNKSNSHKPTKEQLANGKIKAEILAVLADGKARTVTDFLHDVPLLNGCSNQKASALVKQLLDSGDVKREEIKRKAYFSLVVAEDETEADETDEVTAE